MDYSWDVSPTQAIAIQKQLRSSIQITPFEGSLRVIGGADISFNRFDPVVYAGVVLLLYPSLKVVAYSLVKITATFPYIPGLLSFREIPALMHVWEQIPNKPDLVVVDGQGIAHPRRMGIASHFGLVTDTPTIGCAKSPLMPDYTEPARSKGSIGTITDKGEQLGLVIRTKEGVKPVFVSPGHKTNFNDSQQIVLRCVKQHKLPEPTRQAHLYVNRFRKGELQPGFHTV
jgi:deoxyribonuclease V